MEISEIIEDYHHDVEVCITCGEHIDLLIDRCPVCGEELR